MGEVDVSTFPEGFFRSHTEVAKDFRKLEQRMKDEGIFDPCYGYYIREIVKVIFVIAIAFKIILSGTDSVPMLVLAAVLHSFGNQQGAFLLHDSSHNAIT